MNKRKMIKWALPALLMSALTFELMRHSVATDLLMIPENVCNFFSPPGEGMAASCLTLAGVATVIAMVLALVALCFKKDLYKLIGWCSLAAASLASVPYMVQTEEVFMRPNVVIIIILTVCWLLAMVLDKKKDAEEKAKSKGRRL